MDVDVLRRMVEESGDALIACDVHEEIVAASGAVRELLGRDGAALAGHRFQVLLPDRLRRLRDGHFLAHILSKPATGRWSTIRAPVLQPDGLEREVHIKVRRAAGEPPLLLVCLSTLPEEVEIDDPEIDRLVASDGRARLPAGDRLYRTLVENAPLGIFQFDTAATITTCNERFVDIIGSSRRALVGLKLLTLRDPAIVDCVRRTLGGAHSEYEGEYASMTAHKVTPVLVHFAPCYGPANEITGGVGIVEDVTERRRIERERTEAMAMSDLVFKLAPVGLAVLDAQLCFVRVNRELASLNRMPEEAHLGRRVRELLKPAGDQLEELLHEVLKTGEPKLGIESSTVELGISGPPRQLSASGYALGGADGAPFGLGLIVEDVTQRRAEEQARAELHAQARAALAARDHFLRIASHELKTPLTSLAIRLQVMERDLSKGRTIEPRAVAALTTHIDRLAGLVDELLDAARAESGGLPVRTQLVRLDELLQEMQNRLPVRDERHVFHYLAPDEPIWARVDPARLEQAVSNLVSNAVKYSPAGGEVVLALVPHGEQAVISVRDSGLGISAEEQLHLFDQYFRGRDAISRAVGGLGLGLYIVREIVERHGGKIWVQSEPGHGSTFFISLPRVLQPPREETSHPQ